MARQHLAEVNVDLLPEPCRSCLFWETGGPPGPDQPEEARHAAREGKEAWWRATNLEWGACGLGVWDEDRLVGYGLIVPPSYARGAARLGRVTEDALLLAVLWVDDQSEEGAAVAERIVGGALLMVAARGARALEAFASPNGRACLTDERLLRDTGFSLLRSQRPYPHYRLDLRQTARWKETAESALASLRAALRERRVGRVPSLPSP